MAEIDNDISGIATPGSILVNPTTTTTYTQTATFGGKSKRLQVNDHYQRTATPVAAQQQMLPQTHQRTLLLHHNLCARNEITCHNGGVQL
jgi:hypothetical protein